MTEDKKESTDSGWWSRFIDFGKAYATAFAVGAVALGVNSALGSAELRVKNFELAVHVLSNPETPLEVKVFAVDVLKATIPDGVELTEEMEESLKRGTLILSATGTATVKSSASGGGAAIRE